MEDNRMFLRLHAAVPDEAARALAGTVIALLGRRGRVAQCTVARRSASSVTVEIFVEVELQGSAATAFADAMAELGTGWETHCFADGGDWAVWNAGDGTSFAIPGVTWANLECLYRKGGGGRA